MRVWNSISLNTLKVIGIGLFERAVCCLGFSKLVCTASSSASDAALTSLHCQAGGLFMKGRKPLSHVRPSQIWSQTIAKFATYLSMLQVRVYNHIKRLYYFKKFIAVRKVLWLKGT